MRLLSSFLLAVAVLGAGCGGGVIPVVDGAYVRGVVVGPGYRDVDIYLNNLALGRRLSNLDAAPRAEAAFFNLGRPGARTLQIREHASGAPILSAALPLARYTFTTAIALGTPGGTGPTAPRFLIVTDPKSAIPDPVCSLRFLNLSNAGNVDLYVDPANDPTPLASRTPDFQNVAIEDVQPMLTLNPNLWRFIVTRAGTKQTIVDFTDQTIPRTYGILVLSDDATGTGFRLTPYGGTF